MFCNALSNEELVPFSILSLLAAKPSVIKKWQPWRTRVMCAAAQGFQFCVQIPMSTIFQFHGTPGGSALSMLHALDDRDPCSLGTHWEFSHCSAQDQHGLLTEAPFPNPKSPKGSAKVWASSRPEAATVYLLFFQVDFLLPLVTWTLELIGLIFHCKSNKAMKIENRTIQ